MTWKYIKADTIKSFGRFLESGRGPGGRATGRARRRETPLHKLKNKEKQP